MRYGPDSYHSKQQEPEDTCRDLHCRREHYTWTSHPALEGTSCGPGRWCRSGSCVRVSSGHLTGITDNSVDTGHDNVDTGVVHGSWSSWTDTSCRSPCLYSVTGSLSRGSSGLVLSSRSCNNPSPRGGGRHCEGKNFRFRTCNSVRQCMTVRKQSVADHTRNSCEAASRQDTSVLPFGDVSTILEHDNPVQACSVSCFTNNNIKVSRGWTFPDGTVCKVSGRSSSQISFCIQVGSIEVLLTVHFSLISNH